MTITNKFWAIAGATLASVITTTAPAPGAVLVTVNGQQYNIDILTVDVPFDELYYDAAPQLQPQLQPWWGSDTLADDFAAAVGDQLGFPNDWGASGPYFAFNAWFVNPFELPSPPYWFTGTFYQTSCYPQIPYGPCWSIRDLSGYGGVECCQIPYGRWAFGTPVVAAAVPWETDMAGQFLISTTALGLGVKLKQLKNKKKIDLEK